jgi:hypothetical protein
MCKTFIGAGVSRFIFSNQATLLGAPEYNSKRHGALRAAFRSGPLDLTFSPRLFAAYGCQPHWEHIFYDSIYLDTMVAYLLYMLAYLQ